jgi:calpain-5
VDKDKHNWVFARSANPSELWPMILEKAYAKLYRSYEAIEAGQVHRALVDFTNGIGSSLLMTRDAEKQMIRNGTLWTQLLSNHRSGYLMGAGTPSGSDSESNASPSGIVQGHAYSLLDVQEADEFKLIQLRNPW